MTTHIITPPNLDTYITIKERVRRLAESVQLSPEERSFMIRSVPDWALEDHMLFARLRKAIEIEEELIAMAKKVHEGEVLILTEEGLKIVNKDDVE